MVKLVLFDLYYTLIDISCVDPDELNDLTWKAITEKGYNVNKKEFQELTKKIYSKWFKYRQIKKIGVNCRVWWQEILTKLEIPSNPSLLNHLLERRYLTYRRRIRLYDDVLDTLVLLKNRGLKLGILTNSSDGELVRGDLEHLKISQFFDLLIISSEIGLRKPNRNLYSLVLDMLPYRKNEILFIGDDVKCDVEPWLKLGVKAYLLDRSLPTHRAPSTINSLRELETLV